MKYTDQLSIYSPQSTLAADKNIIPAAVQPVGSLTGNVQRGSRQSMDKATSLGVFDRESAMVFFPPGSETSLGDRFVLKDATGEIWLVREGPVVRNRFPATAHVWVFCLNLAVKPSGVD